MPTTQQLLSRLTNKLKELFQLDQPDLDFGFYRIMHAGELYWDLYGKYASRELCEEGNCIFWAAYMPKCIRACCD